MLQPLRTHIGAHECGDCSKWRSRPEITPDPHRLDGGDILVGENAAGHHQDVVGAVLAQQFHHLGEDRHVRAGEDAHQDGVHVLLDSRLDDHLRRLANASVDDLHPGVAQGPRDHLRATIVPVEAGLRHQHADLAFVGHIVSKRTRNRRAPVPLSALVQGVRGLLAAVRDYTRRMDGAPAPGADGRIQDCNERIKNGSSPQIRLDRNRVTLVTCTYGYCDVSSEGQPMETGLTHHIRAAHALRSRPFALLWGGQTISALGDGAYTPALAWQTLVLTHSSAALAAVVSATIVPRLIFLLVGGLVADRLPRRTVPFVSDAGRALVVGAIAALSFSGALELWHLIVLGAIFGVVGAFFLPAYRAMPPLLVTRDALPSANALTELSGQLGLLIGPLIGAGLIFVTGPAAAFAFDSASFVVSAASLLAKRLPRQQESAPAGNT
jgi:Transmembrane secretion effector